MWWMFPDGAEHAPDVHKPFAIELESANARAASRCQTNNQRKVIAPSEMLIPGINARMKQRCERVSDRITRRNSPAFVLIAPVTGKSQIISDGWSVKNTWLDVIDGERSGRVTGLGPVVFAAMPGTISHQAAQLCGNGRVRHYGRCRSRSSGKRMPNSSRSAGKVTPRSFANSPNASRRSA